MPAAGLQPEPQKKEAALPSGPSLGRKRPRRAYGDKRRATYICCAAQKGKGKSPLPWQKRCRGDNPQGAFFASRLRTSRTTLSDRAKLDVTLLYDRAESQLEGRIRPGARSVPVGAEIKQTVRKLCAIGANSPAGARAVRFGMDFRISALRGQLSRLERLLEAPGGARQLPPPGGERGRHCLDAHDVERTAQIVDERRQTEFGAHLFEAARQERALVHPLFDRAERVFDRLAAAVENSTAST